MKRFVITISCLIGLALLVFAWFYVEGVQVVASTRQPEPNVRTEGKYIQRYTDKGWENFEIRGVNLGSGLPGKWSTDYAIDRETYMRWFEQIQQMGANTIRVYSIQNTAFYKALDDFNRRTEKPLYLLQGVWVDDYAQNSHMDAYDIKFRQRLIDDCKAAVDVLHGRRFLLNNTAHGSNGFFQRDVSGWVLGYVIGKEWKDATVIYTDEKYLDLPSYKGQYLQTTENATAFEKMLAEVGDQLIAYETSKYADQKLISFANGRSTDPFTYPDEITEFFSKCASVDIEHIIPDPEFKAGLFASYSAYTCDMDYLSLMEPAQWQTLIAQTVDFRNAEGIVDTKNTYRAYLKLLNAYHTMPVVIIEFGAASSRGLAQQNNKTSFQNGHLSEKEQADVLVKCSRDIADVGCAGGCVFAWQDEWNRRTWNTLFATDLSRNAYWSDAQTGDQHFGLLAMEPGKQQVCVVDGDVSEWSDKDVVKSYADSSSISMKYDEGYVYLRVYKPDFVFGEETLYIPIDTTQKTGTQDCTEYGLTFDRPVDFLIKLHNTKDSELLVQDRYHAIHANYEEELIGQDAYIDPPAADSAVFETVQMAMKDSTRQYRNITASLNAFDTGRLRFGNADPESEEYDSLADFMVKGDNLEIRIPWGLLNFADPSKMKIHDDYYAGNYGVKFISLRKMALGLGNDTQKIEMGTAVLKGWGDAPTYHERLKQAYDALQREWTGGGAR